MTQPDASSQPAFDTAVASPAATAPDLSVQQAMDGLDLAVSEVVRMLTASGMGGGQCEDMARQLLMGAWLNRHNSDWNPLDPSTHRPDPNDPLLALLSQWG